MEDKVTKGGRTRRTTTAKAPATAAAKPAATRPAAASRKAAAPRKASAAPAGAPAAAGGPDRAELVRMAAYFRAEQRGFAPGYEVEDWLAAEAEVALKLGASPPAAPRPAAPRKTPSRKSNQA